MEKFKRSFLPDLEEIRIRRKELKTSTVKNASELARLFGISAKYLNKIESGSVQGPSYLVLKKIFTALDNALEDENLLQVDIPEKGTAGSIAEPCDWIQQSESIEVARARLKNNYAGLLPILDDKSNLVDCLTYKRLFNLKDFRGTVEEARKQTDFDSRNRVLLRETMFETDSIDKVREALMRIDYGAVLIRRRGNRFGVITARRLLDYLERQS